MATRIGIDVGGTFTDLIYCDEDSGATVVHKVPTTTEEPARGCLEAILQAVPRERLRDVRYLLYGTTVGLNALIERKGAVVGLLATRGFRDILDLRRGSRLEIYNIFWRAPPALVPRRLRIPITERMLADGRVHTPLARAEVRDAVERFRAEGVTSVAVAFLHAYANPAHELAAEAELRSAGFTGEIVLSHRLSGEYREYERTSTTTVEAFIRGRIASDLHRVESGLRTAGFTGELFVTRSGGGAMTFEEGRARAFEVIQSGPVGGAEGAALLARRLGLTNLITADVGGTSFDTCIIQAGQIPLLFQGSVTDLPIQCPWIDVRSIGAGGGSLIHIDRGGLLDVGPRSAGARPGPACFGRGGLAPTLTDAALVLGMLGDGRLATGLELDIAAARRALASVGDSIGMTVEQAAQGAVRLAAAKMAGAIHGITVARALDPRTMTLLPFGGAGPVFATLLGGELGIEHVLVPPHAGNFSAWGQTRADLVRAISMTRIMPLDAAAMPALQALFKTLFADLAGRRTGARRETQHVAVMEVRYRGQEHTLSLDGRHDGSRLLATHAALQAEFLGRYRSIFGSDLGDCPLEVVALRASIREALPLSEVPPPSSVPPLPAKEVRGYSFTQDRWLTFQLLDRAGLKSGERLAGPAIIKEATATTYVDADYSVRVDESRCLVLTRNGAMQ